MAISPPSDIVLDVVRAADPGRQRLAAARLTRLGSGVAGAAFAAAVDEAVPGKAGLADARAKLASLATVAQAPDARTAKTLQQFEAQVISTFIEQMLPAASAESFGTGTAGDVWRSMLSEQIANQVAKSGGLGIREKIQAALALQPGAGAAGAQLPDRVLDSKIAGANLRDLALPLASEQRFLKLMTPSAAAGSRGVTSQRV